MNVIVMRRDLADDEVAALRKYHPDDDIKVHRAAPQSAQEHLLKCRELGARVVFLPHEEPIPNPAMRDGVKHVIFKDGQLLELVRLVPEFKPYSSS